MVEMKHTVWIAAVLLAGGARADSKIKPPHGAQHVSIDYTWQSFTKDERHYKLAWNGTAYTADKRTIDPKLVDVLIGSLVNLRPAPDTLRCMSHTDDYPAFTIAIDGDDPVTIVSESNCHAYVPWNITRGGKHLVQFDGSIWRALSPLLAAADDRWKTGGNQPIATTTMGGEMVALGEYKAGDPVTGDAASCAHSFETSPQAHAILGDAITVSELVLGCDLAASPDCTVGETEASVVWQGLSAQLDLPCTNGQVTMPPPLVASLTELKGFMASKPVRTLVKLASSPPRMWNNGNWAIDGGMTAPMLSWKPGTTTIEARSMGEKLSPAYWKELGIDAAKLATKRDGYVELDLKLDFSGKRVK
jgi:hypothetical protein